MLTEKRTGFVRFFQLMTNFSAKDRSVDLWHKEISGFLPFFSASFS